MKFQRIFLLAYSFLCAFINIAAQVDTIDVIITPLNSGTVTGAGFYTSGSQVNLDAIAASGYKFNSWTENNYTISNDSSYSFISFGNRNITANFSLKAYSINLSVDPIAGGTVNGNGIYNHGDIVELQALSEVGYKFVNWTENGIEVSQDSLFSFIANKDRSLKANFELLNFVITVNSQPNVGGTTTGSGTYTYNDLAKLEAISNTGYTFLNWTENNAELSTNQVFEFTVLNSRTIDANFSINFYDANAEVNPIQGGEVIGVGSYEYGSEINLVARPYEGYTFLNWTQNGAQISADSILSLTLTSDTTITANFELKSFQINLAANPIQGGVVSGSGTYFYGELVTLTAISVDGYKFMNWNVSDSILSTDSNYTFVCKQNMQINGNFSHKLYYLTTTSNPIEAGIIHHDTIYEHGSIASISSNTNYGWNFENWTENGNIISIDSNYSFVIFNSRSLTANYSRRNFNLSASVEPAEAGLTDGDGAYPYDYPAKITAIPNYGWDFSNWIKDNKIISSDSTITMEMDSSKSLLAVFTKKIFSIEAVSNPQIGGIITGDSDYTFKDMVTLIAQPDSLNGWDFLNWTENGTEVSKSKYFTFEASQNRKLLANFRLRNYEIDLDVYPSNSGAAIGSGQYTHGEEATISAQPAPGWLFANWSDGINNISSDSILTFNVNENKTLIANFAHELYTIGTTASPAESGFITGSGSFYYGQKANLIPIANPGWEFVNWTLDGTLISEDSVLVLDVTNSINLKANFKLINYMINCSANPIDAGYTSGCGLSFYDQEMTLTATPNSGWSFTNWTENGEIISTSPTLVLKIQENRDVLANFDQLTDMISENHENIIPDHYYISNPYPNPFNPSTVVNFGIPENSNVKAILVDVNGRIISTLISNEIYNAGTYTKRIVGDNLASGIYLFILSAKSQETAKSFKKVSKLLLIK